MSNKTLLEEIRGAEDDFPLPSTSIAENNTLLETDDGNVTAATTPHPFQVPELQRFIDRNSWVIYVVVGALTLCVIAIVFLLLRNLCKKKKQVIQQNDDPMLSSTYEDGGANIFYRILCCQWKNESTCNVRSNSESNLDPYKRPPLPPIGTKEGDFHYISPFSSNGLSSDEKHHAAYINAIRGVAHVPQRAEQYRALPTLHFQEIEENPKKSRK